MIRFCPNCQTERPVDEILCEGLHDGQPCGWDLSGLPLRLEGWRPPAPVTTPVPAATSPDGLQCENGHLAAPGDLICAECGADIVPALHPAPAATAPPQDLALVPAHSEVTIIAGWRLLRRVDSASHVQDRFETLRETDGRRAILTLYASGSEPDSEVYDALRRLDRDHVPEILETGRWDHRAYEVSEDLRGGSFADLAPMADDLPMLRRVVEEIGGALAALAECGLRHRDLGPEAIMVRSADPLDLVLTSFGSARLSDYDLEVVSPLEITRYTAPEAVAGAVAAASDWWSLGMLILGQLTHDACFGGAGDQPFLISVLTNGAPIPDDLPAEVDLLLRGLLALDRHERWSWPQVQLWLEGQRPWAPSRLRLQGGQDNRHAIMLGGARIGTPERFALAAAEAANWDPARQILLSGELVTWLEETGQPAALRAKLRNIIALSEVSEDFRLALALKALNPAMPFVVRGEIITPGWLIDHPEDGYALVSGPIPERLAADDEELWLSRLNRREARVRDRARQLDVALDEDQLRVAVLSTSKSRLAAVWADRRRILPDTDHPGLLAILERRITEDEDLILLLAASAGQFRAVDAIVDEAADAASRAGLADFDREAALQRTALSRRQLHAEIEERLEGFARCDRERIDEWADQFRLERRLPLPRALALLSVPKADWKEPPRQTYVATLLDFFSRRITGSIMRGPLTRMVIGKTTARLDLLELDSPRRSARALLDHVLLRNDQSIEIDPAPFTRDPRVEQRLRKLHSHATLYRRDTGIDGLYMGFPFLVMQEARASTRPRIAPVLLWPIRLHPEIGTRARVALAFDRDREEVRLNPAFETLLGKDMAQRWLDAAHDVLGRASITAAEVVEAFSDLAHLRDPAFGPLPTKEMQAKRGEDRVVSAAALFHLGFLGQAVMEDLRQLKARPPTGSALETAFRTGEEVLRAEMLPVPERERYFTADSDPSQEAAVIEARSGRGLLVEGPPGTGKSQTIVNMVADAIGTGRSLLVVCQKQAALEVVQKRLVAAGLGDRIVMVNDVNKDREPVIRAIREQLETLNALGGGGIGWKQQREQAAAQIELLEADLDGHHHALHVEDAATGLSYRLILGDLVGLQRQGYTPPLAALRPQLGALDLGSLTVLQETCAPIARLWLTACWEGSPLAATRPFGTDAGTIETFADDLLAFDKVERTRHAVLARTPEALTTDNPDPIRAWARDQGARLMDLDHPARERLARWLHLFESTPAREPGSTEPQRELGRIERQLSSFGPDAAPDAEVEVARSLSNDDLDRWTGLSDKLREASGFLGVLSPSRWIRARQLRLLLKRNGLTDAAGMNAALHRERALRPLRDRLVAVLDRLGELPGLVGLLRVPAMLDLLRQTSADLAAVEMHVTLIEACPDRDAAFAMARGATRPAVEHFIARIYQGLARYAARQSSCGALDRLGAWMADDWTTTCREAITEDRPNEDRLVALIAAMPQAQAYQRFRPRVPQIGPAAMAVLAQLARLRPFLEDLPEAELEATVRRILATEARLAWKARLEGANPMLLFEAEELAAKTAALVAADRRMRELNRRLLVDGLEARQLKPLRDWEDITRLRGQRARRLREFVDRGTDLGLMRLRPVWLLNPDVASRLLPLRKALFDTVIFDEASQMPIEYALPTLFRSARMIVSGDEKQMPPTNFFTSRVENDEAEIYEGGEDEDTLDEAERDAVEETWNRREIKDCPDLLQLAKTVLPPTTLQIHYRSSYRELIQFSNASFYLNRLSVPARHPADEIRRKKPIELIRVDGTYVDQTNPDEAERVVDVLADIWRQDGTPPTVGVVTFNRKQADLIDEVLETRAERDPAFRAAMTRERDRVEGGEDMSFFVKNVENVQGDERDVIVFSSTFARNAQGTFRRNFGVLGQSGGERRLNVAVTRARRKVVLVTSMPIPMISDFLSTRRQASSPRDYLQAYFEYARAMSDGDLDAARSLLSRLTPDPRRGKAGRTGAGDADGLDQAVADEIRAMGWTPTRVDDEGAFGLDFAIEDPRTGLYGIGIECDAPRHALLATARAREMWRPQVLQRSIPLIHRVSSLGWFNNPEYERGRLRAAVEQAMGEVA